MTKPTKTPQKMALGAIFFVSACTCGEPRTDVPELHVPRVTTPITIDGDLSDWDESGRTETFVDTMSGAPSSLTPTARLRWDDEAIYVAVSIEDPLLRAPGMNQDNHLWENDCLEMMIDPDGDGERYIELQISPRNVVFDTWFDMYRSPQPVGHVEWSSEMRTAVRLHGAVDDDVADQGYDVELAIPWRAFGVAGMNGDAPAAGSTYRFQLYVLDARGDGQLAVGWSAPLVGDFHVPARFGRLTFDR